MRGCAVARACCAALLLATGCSRTAAPGASPAPTDCPAPLPALRPVRQADPTIRVDLRYATANNFTSVPLPGYAGGDALLRPAAAAALARVQQRLRADGLGLKVWDAYRPVRATLAMVEWAERTRNEWVLEQGYVARRSGHNGGATVDLTLVRLDTGEELDMGTAYDTFSEAAHTANASGEVRANRTTLVRAMRQEGWTNYEKEWWHFSYRGEYEPMDAALGCF